MTWDAINLANLGDRQPIAPTTCGLVYPSARHVFSGPPESAKTWAALILGLEEIRSGGTVAHVDFEMFEYETRDRLRCLGATDDELERFLHVEPEEEASPYVIEEFVQWHQPTLVLIDAAAGAYGLQGLDDNARRDVEIFAQSFIEPFRVRGVGSILLDHVTKSTESRGRFAIGSERKVGGADVHLGFEPVVPFGRGRTGLVKVVVHKDRFGHLARPVLTELELRSDPDTHHVTWQFREPSGKTDDGWQPTALMEKVSRFVAEQSEPVSQRTIESNVTGRRREYVRQAVKALAIEGFISEATPGRGYVHVRSYTAPDRAPAAPGALTPTSAPGAPAPSKGAHLRAQFELDSAG